MDTRFNQTKLKKLQIFNGSQLKYLAFASMLIDHVNNALITPYLNGQGFLLHLSNLDRKSTRLNSSHIDRSRMPSSA